jgi:hypothetical protein
MTTRTEVSHELLMEVLLILALGDGEISNESVTRALLTRNNIITLLSSLLREGQSLQPTRSKTS